MASTLFPSAAFDFAKVFIKRMYLDDVKAAICDDAAKMMWGAAPWRWTISAFPTVTLVANTQDYTVAIPSDFLYLQEAYLTNENGDPKKDLEIGPLRVAGGSPGIPAEVSISGTPGTNGTLRTFPKIGTIKTGDTVKIFSTYKKTATTITTGNIGTAILAFDDDWYWVYRSGVLYFAFLYAHDPRAGEAVIDDKGNWKFTGQRGVFEANLALMRDREKLANFGGRLLQEVKQK
jgi:TM2 domain-containing membrane protein YozV